MGDISLPLQGINVLDLSSLLPGPLATLILEEAGADVVKIERPGVGDEMRTYDPKFGSSSANYAILNRGKHAFAADFKDIAQRDLVLELARDADVVVEQFRPGVADRLGLGYEDVKTINPDVIYCSITGYGHSGPNAHRAGHDLNYLAEAGLLGVVRDSTGSPALPPTVIADIAGGTYPAVVNILLALRHRDRTGHGCHLDVSMTHNLQVLGYGYFASHQVGAGWPTPAGELLTGGSPRYNIYPTADGRHIACAALEDKFWTRLLELIGLPEEFRDDGGNERSVIEALRARFSSEPAAYWRELLHGEDVCTVLVATHEEAVEAGLIDCSAPDLVAHQENSISTLPSPVAPALRRPPMTLRYPDLTPLQQAAWPVHQ